MSCILECFSGSSFTDSGIWLKSPLSHLLVPFVALSSISVLFFSQLGNGWNDNLCPVRSILCRCALVTHRIFSDSHLFNEWHKAVPFSSSLSYGPSEWWFSWIFMVFDTLTWFTISSYSHKDNPHQFIPFSFGGRASLCLGGGWWLVPVPLYPSYSSLSALVLWYVTGRWCPAKGLLHVSKKHLQSWQSAEDTVVSMQSQSVMFLF